MVATQHSISQPQIPLGMRQILRIRLKLVEHNTKSERPQVQETRIGFQKPKQFLNDELPLLKVGGILEGPLAVIEQELELIEKLLYHIPPIQH